MKKKSVLIPVYIFLGAVLLSKCIDASKPENNKSNIRFSDFAGTEKCAQCHQKIYNDYIHTAHFNTGQLPEPSNFKGSFKEDENHFYYNKDLVILMQPKGNERFQDIYYKGEKKMSLKFDMIFGSGTKGQSFGSWKGNRIFQLPITWFREARQWSISPGLRTDKVITDKPVTARCLECHATYAEALDSISLDPMEFAHDKILLGIGCEKCHGAGMKHVQYHEKKPGEASAKFIENPGKHTIQQQMDLCALCHSSTLVKTKPSFQFTAGNRLSDYFRIDSLNEQSIKNNLIDVHGNQLGLLKASECFRKSSKLTCLTCHDPHKNEKEQLVAFAQKCAGCHNTTEPAFQTASHLPQASLMNNCIDCHMPSTPSKVIAVKLERNDSLMASYIRSHRIGIYPDISKKIISKIKSAP